MRIYFLLFNFALVSVALGDIDPDEANVEPAGSKIPLISNGETAAAGEFPYQVALQISSLLRSWLCGGSLISEDRVLTSAHCTRLAVTINIQFGSNILDGPEAQFRTVSRANIKRHPLFNPLTYNNDIAVLSFPRIALSPNIQPISLPESCSSYTGQTANASGWGFTSDESTSARPTNLQYVGLTVIDNSVCRNFYFIVTDNMLCTESSDNKSICSGDNGGPLVTETSEGNKTQIGIISFVSRRGCESGFPVGYTRVCKYARWIQLQ